MSSSAPDEAPQEVMVGPHMFRWEPPDIGCVIYHGDLDGPTTADLSEAGRRFTKGRPYVFLLVDVSKLGKVSAEARRGSATGGKDINLRGVAVVGASATLRVISSLVTRAVDLLNGNTDNPTRFFQTEAEARAWITGRRQQVQKSQIT